MVILRADLNISVNLCVECLISGGVAIIPTETVYGLVCDAGNNAAVNKIYSIKKREKNKPLAVFVKDVEVILKNIATATRSKVGEFGGRFMPGPCTIIVPIGISSDLFMSLAENMRVNLTKEGDYAYIGIRIPDSKIASSVIDDFGFALAATSVNYSGEVSAVCCDKIDSHILSQVGVVIADDGEVVYKTPSTIVKFFLDGRVELLRSGTLDGAISAFCLGD